MQNQPVSMDEVLLKIEARERRARRNALLYTLVPIVVAGLLAYWTVWQVNNANQELAAAQQRLAALQARQDAAQVTLRELAHQRDQLTRELSKTADAFTAIAISTRAVEQLIESKRSYLRTLDEARYLIDLRMKFDDINKQLLSISQSFPQSKLAIDDRVWVVIVRSSKDLAELKHTADSWIARFGASRIAIYKTPNNFYALVVRSDDTFTEAYRLTVALQQDGTGPGAYFENVGGWGSDLLHP